VARYRPSVLWNDIAWPAGGRALWALMTHYYAAVPDGVLNDRWMPWSPLMGAARATAVRRVLDTANAAVARRSGGGVIPPRPPHFDVRTPEYTVFDRVPAEPWECVRGMDRSFGYNRASGPEDFITPDELVGMFADVVAKGGNLLLNVGPRGEDAAIPAEQSELLETLGSWASGPGRSAFGSRPWVTPAATSPEGHDLRFWARGDTVWAAVLGRPEGGPVTLSGLRAGPATTVQARSSRGRGKRLRQLGWDDLAPGVRIELPARLDHPVLELTGVTA
jgi:alpha-L-fucosidase